ncbi:Sorbin and SH3 domain-containing protein 2 [Rhizoclosmatium hyalinum]|nr:Sorbin and SH3 domain-containing protein 2 [Rhizoclosmatium hyalinum]
MKTWIDDSTTFASQMTNSYQCPGWTGAGLRYHITAYCGVFAYMGSMKNCSAQTNTASAILTPVCQATVTNFITSWKEVMSNPSVCSASPTPDGADGRSKYLALFTQLNQMSNSGCTVAVDLDADKFCGYKTLEDGQKYCQTNWDPCCAYNGLTQVLPSPPAPVATTTPTPASPASAAMPILPIAIGGGAAVVLLIIVTACICYRRSKKLAEEEDEAKGQSSFTYSPATPGNNSYEMNNNKNQGYFGGNQGMPPYQQLHQGQDGRSEFDNYNKFGNVANAGNKSRDSYYKAIVPTTSPYAPPINTGYPAAPPKKYQAVINFKALKHDELSLIIGDVIVIKEEYDDGWCFGQNIITKVSGFFPMECVAEPSAAKKQQFNKANNFNKRASSVYGTSMDSHDGSFAVKFDYQPNMSDELLLRYGERVVVFEEYDDGWAYGKKKGTNLEGLFPLDILQNYISKRFTDTLRKDRNSSRHSTKVGMQAIAIPKPGSSPLAPKDTFDVVFDFVPMQNDEIPLRKGQRVKVQKEYDDGWAYGVNVSTSATGLFPLDCLQRDVETLRKQRMSSIFEAGPAIPKPSDGMEKVIYAFEPERSDEIFLRVGDKIKITKAYDDGWAYGTNFSSGETGNFPLDCLESHAETTSIQNGKKANKARQSSIYDAVAPAATAPVTTSGNGDEIVMTDFKPERDDEVALRVGDTIQVTERFDDGWCYGKNLNTGKEGYLPQDCLASFFDPKSASGPKKQRMSSIYDSEYGGDNNDIQQTPVPPLVAKPGFDDVVSAYAPERADEVALRIGDRVNIQKAFDDGWCYGTNLNNGKSGYFPYDCLKSYPTNNNNNNKKAATDNKKKQRVSSIYDSDSVYYGNEAKATTPAKAEPQEKASTAIYAYEPQASDELALRVGDQIVTLQEYDDGWGYGRNLSSGGQEGVFPIDCIAKQAAPAKDTGKGSKNRGSSLYVSPNTPNAALNTPKPVAAPSVPLPSVAPTTPTNGPRTVVYNFNPERSDEVALRVGDKVQVTHTFDDGWSFGKNVTSGREGNFPTECLAGVPSTGANVAAGKNPNRVSSIYGAVSEYSNSVYDYQPQAQQPQQQKQQQQQSRTVLYAFQPQQHDELTLRVGDRVVIEHEYDDGWAQGFNQTTNASGLFPLDCLAGNNTNAQAANSKFNKRGSSMYGY